MKWYFFYLAGHAQRVVRSGLVEEEDVNYRSGSNCKWEQEMEGEESGECGIVYGESSSNSLY